MKKKNYYIQIPEQVGAELNLSESTPINLVVQNDKLVVQLSQTTSQRLKRNNIRPLIASLSMGLVMGVAMLITLIASKLNTIPLEGDNSISSWTIALGLVVGMISFTSYFLIQRHNPHNHFARNIYWRNLPVILVSIAMILLVVLIGLFWVLETVFHGVTLDRYTGSLIFAILCASINLIMAKAAIYLDATGITTLISVMIVGGVIISMVSNGHREWWKVNLSFLGTNDAINNWQFNFTLIFSALLTVALIDYLFVGLRVRMKMNWKLITLRVLLTLTALDLGLVGIFPNNADLHYWHVQAAGFLVYFILALVIGVKWLLPNISVEFLSLSYLIAIALVVLGFSFQVFHYLSLTVFEILAFSAAFSWLLLLINQIQQLTVDEIPAQIVRKSSVE
jgi:hypothetical membrane protein